MKKTLSLFLCMFALSGCGGDGGNDNDPQIGYLTYTGIRGLSYQTQSQSGITGERGEFYYYPGETISFSLAGIPLVQDIPAKSRLSPLDLEPSYADELRNGTTVDGLTSHRPVEQELVASANHLINIYRLLLTIDTDENVQNGIYVTDDTLDEINTFPFEDPISFDQPISTFGNPDIPTAPENRLIKELCFVDVWGDFRCADPTVGRAFSGDSEATAFMNSELDTISKTINSGIYLSPYSIELKPGDNRLHTVDIKLHSGDQSIAEIQTLSSNDAIVTVHHTDPETQKVVFYNTSTSDNAEATLFINVRLAGDYRWNRKNLGVRIHPDANR